MSATDGIFSIRIVVADFYVQKPIQGLDPCYCQFRGKDIKKVPVIRIFGSNAEGQKTCMHVHGVFPYFYIPYEKNDLGDVEKAIYQISSSVDKAINISLGQGSSQQTHVFKIQLVKGIPFYGFHRREHQYLKIYMFNPRFVRRAANLFQNGAILGKVFQPHESHVPYILQFLIDYNLYGMSLLHIPKEIVKFRTIADAEIPYQFSSGQLLDSVQVPKLSTSELEVDISAAFILNRFQLLKNKAERTNPGMEAIWQDEKVRRLKLIEQMKEVPPLEGQVTPSQERLGIEPTESDLFYRTALQQKLLNANAELSQDQSLMLTFNETTIIKDNVKEKKRTFNLKSFLINSVYPEECTQEDNLVNASFIENHFSNETAADASRRQIEPLNSSDDVFLNDTIVDEELVLSLTQHNLDSQNHLNISLHEQDYDLLEVMKQLEENENHETVDLDSSLAPLTQTVKSSQKVVSLEKTDEIDELESSDSEDCNDYTMVLEDIDELLLKISQTSESKKESIPQIDGADDDIPRTPPKRILSNIKGTPKTPKRATASRTPKSKSRYRPLDFLMKAQTSPNKMPKSTIDNVLVAENDIDSIISTSSEEDIEKNNNQIGQQKNHTSLRKRIVKKRQHKMFLENNNSGKTSNMIDNDAADTIGFDLDKTKIHVTCNLTPKRSTNKTVKRLQTYNTLKKSTVKNNNEKTKSYFNSENSNSSQLTQTEIVKKSIQKQDHVKNLFCKEKLDELIPMDTVEQSKIVRSKNNEKLNKFKLKRFFKNNTVKDKKNLILKKCSVRLSRFNASKLPSENKDNSNSVKKRKSSPSDVAREFDRRNNFYPEAGPSHIHYYQYNDFPYSVTPTTETNTRLSNMLTPTILACTDNDDNEICTFDEQSFLINSPSLFSDGSPASIRQDSPIVCDIHVNPLHSGTVIITPRDLPPTLDDLEFDCIQFNIPDIVHQTPFFSIRSDVMTKKDVGNTVLSIPGKALRDYEEFKSSLPSIVGINDQRILLLTNIGIPLNYFKTNDDIKQYLATNEKVIISSRDLPPTRQDANFWLKAQENANFLENFEDFSIAQLDGVDSPIKIQRQKVSMMMVDDLFDEDIDSSMRSLNSSPLTPVIIEDKNKNVNLDSVRNENNITPRSSQSSGKRILRKTFLRRNPLMKKFKYSTEVVEKNVLMDNSTESCTKIKDSQESTKSSDSFKTEEDLKESNRTSFLKSFQADLDSSFGLSAATLDNTYGFKVNLENLNEAKADIEYTYLTTLSMEVFVETRDDLKPNPEFDKIWCLFYSIVNSVPIGSNSRPSTCKGLIIVEEKKFSQSVGLPSDIQITTVKTEMELLSELVLLCRYWDPDIYAGYEIELSSWGYVMDRAKYLELNISPLLSRVPSQNIREVVDMDNEGFTDLDVEIKLCGRILLDVWRLMRSEIALTSYTFENVMYHILHRRCPLHSFRDLTKWFMADQTRWIVLNYYIERVNGTLELLDQLDLIGRTSEMAKLIGIQFYEVLSRGSQFRVESMMLRIAKPRNLVPLSPSVQQRAHMRAPEYLPLILEPQSRFYVDPLIVLDFQSLYPSIIIGYNYCFSTCLGRVEHLGQALPFEFGASQYRCSPKIISKLIENDLITISPCGVVFVKSTVREGILPRMLSEILDTRLMVKQSMKIHRNNSALQRILHSRQLGLKLMANVTYGYTAANFSGRMPCVEVGDSVVAKGRETLERAIKLVESNEKWNVKVVYGDTDSLFVLVPGRSREEAFRIGEEISEAVTKCNPQPIKLKLEKVYQPCILQTKKRYVGYMYESADQIKPTYEAKGIETVRRDGCPAVAKMLEKCLRILFETRDVSKVKNYVCRQFTKLLSGKANLQDLIFAKEFRGLNGYKPTACVPALELTRKWIQSDPRNIPRRGERVPFIVTNGPPGYPLIRLVRSPHEVLANEGLKINAIYYITKAIIPPINRCFLLIGADVNDWFADLPRKLIQTPALSIACEIVGNNANKKSTISQYFSSTNCITDCGRQTQNGICEICSHNPKSIVKLNYKINRFELGYQQTKLICKYCCERFDNISCQSLDCPVLYILNMKKRQQNQNKYLQSILKQNFP